MKSVFQKIIDKEIDAKIIYEDEKIIAFLDINPITPGHFLVVPKVFSSNLIDIDEKTFKYLFWKANELAKKEIEKLGVDGFKLLVNNGKNSGQEIFHSHIHIIPSKKHI